MRQSHLNVLLADDDPDDCIFFKSAIDSYPISLTFISVNDGEQLMKLLARELYQLPHVLFLDFNMPRKNGFECLSEIKLNSKLKSLPVVIFSTSFEAGIVNLLYDNGAQYYIRKPAQFSRLKDVIHRTLDIIADGVVDQPSKEEFVLTA